MSYPIMHSANKAELFIAQLSLSTLYKIDRAPIEMFFEASLRHGTNPQTHAIGRPSSHCKRSTLQTSTLFTTTHTHHKRNAAVLHTPSGHEGHDKTRSDSDTGAHTLRTLFPTNDINRARCCYKRCDDDTRTHKRLNSSFGSRIRRTTGRGAGSGAATLLRRSQRSKQPERIHEDQARRKPEIDAPQERRG